MSQFCFSLPLQVSRSCHVNEVFNVAVVNSCLQGREMPGCVELQAEFESFSIRLVELCKFGRLVDGNLVNFEVSIELSEPYVRIGA